MTKTSCVVPAYNEEKTIGRVLKVLKEAKEKGLIDELIVVSDGSRDRTVEIAKDYAPDQLLVLSRNRGKAFALIEGLKRAKSSFILLLDADLINLTIEHIKQLLQPIQKNQADMVVGYLSDDFWQKLLPSFSGQRAITFRVAQLLLKERGIKKSGYNFELILNKLVNQNKLKTLYVPLAGLTHLAKQHKYPPHEIFAFRLSFFFRSLWFYKKIPILMGLIALVAFLSFLFFGPLPFKNTSLVTLSEPKENQRILVVVAHPDDEAIGASGYIQRAQKNKATVYLVIVTAGEANRFTALWEDKNPFLKKTDFRKEAQNRIKESKEALLSLKVDPEKIYFLGFPDRRLNNLLTKNWTTPLSSPYLKTDHVLPSLGFYQENLKYTGQNLNSLLCKLFEEIQPDLIITHSEKDHHPDHKAVSRFVKIALAELTKREAIQPPQLYAFLVHFKISEYPRPLRYAPDAPLLPPKDLQNEYSWRTLPLTQEEESKKEKAIKKYKSQLLSPYLKELLLSSIRTNELFYQDNF